MQRHYDLYAQAVGGGRNAQAAGDGRFAQAAGDGHDAQVAARGCWVQGVIWSRCAYAVADDCCTYITYIVYITYTVDWGDFARVVAEPGPGAVSRLLDRHVEREMRPLRQLPADHRDHLKHVHREQRVEPDLWLAADPVRDQPW